MFKAPEAEIVLFLAQDVVTTSTDNDDSDAPIEGDEEEL